MHPASLTPALDLDALRPCRRGAGALPGALHRWARRLTDLSILGYLLLLCTPRALYEPYYAWQYSLEYPLVGLAAGALVIERIFNGTRFTKTTILLTTLGIMMLLAGIFHGNYDRAEPRWFFIDCGDYAGVVVGAFWSFHRTMNQIVSFFRTVCYTCGVMLILNVWGLWTGLLTPMVTGPRVYNLSLSPSVAIVSYLLPFLTVRPRSGRAQFLPWMITAVLMLAIAAASVISAIRSMVLPLAVCAIAVAVVFWRQSPIRPHFKIALLLALCAAAIVIVDQGSSTRLATRLSDTNLESESRLDELKVMFAQMDGRYLIGNGFGGSYYVSRITDLSGVAYTPHVGVFGSLWKGGLVAAVIVYLLPIALLLRRFFGARLDPYMWSLLGLLCVYFTGACLSGGWRFFSLFFYTVAWTKFCAPSGIHRHVKRRAASLFEAAVRRPRPMLQAGS
jgi:hypothetical protein